VTTGEPARLGASHRAEVRSLAWLGAAGTPIAVAGILAFRDGGYYLTSWGVAAMVLWAMVAVAALVGAGGVGGPLGLVAVSGWVGLGIWQGVSGLWADEPAAATNAMNLTLLYAAAFTLTLVATRGAATLRRLLELALLAALAVALAALAARLIPEVGAAEARGRLSTPISYWNNLALVFAFGVPLALGIGADPSRHRVVRAAAAATLPVFPLGILFAQSRGALVALLVGVAVAIGLARGRLETIWLVTVGGAVSLLLMLYANAQEALRAESVMETPHEVEGHRVALALLAAAVLCAAGSLGVEGVARLVREPRRRRRVGAVLAAAAAIAVVAGVAAARPDGGPLDWADRQFESFKRYDPSARDDATSVADRLAVAAGSGRWQNWQVARDEFADAPATGTGAGDYRFRWASERPVDLDVRNAHSLYLEVLGESGVIGLLLLLAPLAAVAIAVALAVRRHPAFPVARDLGVACAAGAVVAVHLAGDWAWQMPAVVIPGLVLGAAALRTASVERGDDGSVPAWGRWTVAVAAVGALLVVAGPTASAHREGDARAAAAAGRLPDALALAGDAVRLNPQDPASRLLRANVLDDMGRPALADAAFAEAMTASPHDWTIRASWASALMRRGERAAARALLASARPLNPLDARLRELRRALEGAAAP
jgi:tetratricopeptide (TPR) repeat protein